MYNGIRWSKYEVKRIGVCDRHSKQRFRTGVYAVSGINKRGKSSLLAVVLGKDRARKLGRGAIRKRVPKKQRNWYGG